MASFEYAWGEGGCVHMEGVECACMGSGSVCAYRRGQVYVHGEVDGEVDGTFHGIARWDERLTEQHASGRHHDQKLAL